MATQVQTRRGTTAEHSTFTGANGELTVDTTKKTVVVHDGSTLGGVPLAKESALGSYLTTANAALSYAPKDSPVFVGNPVGPTPMLGNRSNSLATTAYVVDGFAPLDSPVFTGTATAPSVTVTGSTVPTNGLYLPSANSVAISTGGSGRLFVDASGNVWVQAASSATSPVFSLRQTGAVQWNTNLTTTDGFYQIGIDGGQTGYTITRSATAINSHIFSTGGSERLRITSAGLVGVGTSSPSATLYVNNASGIDPSLTYGATAGQTFKNGTTELAFGAATTAPFAHWMQARFSTNAAQPLLLNPLGGNVGIGTTSPSAIVHSTVSSAGVVFRGSHNNTGLDLYANDATGEARITSARLGGSGGKFLSFYTDTGSGEFERARIDSSGRLLVGTSSASAADATIIAQGNAQNSTFGSRLYLARGEATPADGAGLGHLNFSDSTHTVSAMIRAIRDGGTWSGSSKPTRLEFSTTADGASSPTERMRIANNGAITVSNAADNIFASSNVSPGTSNFFFLGFTSGSSRVVIWNNGNVVNTNNSYGAISDAKLKENIVDATSQWDDVKSLQVRKYNFKEGQTHTQIGLVAQEVELVSPGLVSESPDRDADGNDLGTVTKSVNYSVLYMKAVKALQEAMERIEVLEQRLTDAGIA